MGIGINLRKHRKKAKLTQRQLADAVGVKNNTVSDWESERTSPDTDAIKLICETLHVSADVLLKTKRATQDYALNGLTDDEAKLLQYYNNLNEEGRDLLSNYAQDLVTTGRYIKKTLRMEW